MRTKSFLVFIFCVFATTVVLFIFGSQQPDSLQNIVTTTHQQIRNFQDNLRDAEQKNLVADEKYLKRLGFTRHPRLYPNASWHNTSLPVIVTYVREGQHGLAIGLIAGISRLLSNHTILVYDLGLSNHDLQTLSNYCNSSRCQVVPFDLRLFPSHVEDDRLHAFRPLVIQDALDKTGAVFYVENDLRPYRNVTTSKLAVLFDRAFHYGGGVLAWPIKNAVSSLTHPKMFDYFHTEADMFYFLPMVEAKQLVIVNGRFVHEQIMLPWIQCALTADCILPIGAQSAGCRFKKPQYRYSGCHSYDVSALSIVLGLKHSFNETGYMVKGTRALFETVTIDRANVELAAFERNTTSESSSVFAFPST